MRDLYLRLGISTDANADEIASAISAKPHLGAVADVLLNPQRRAAYQRTVFTLRSIGELRHRLGLDDDASWFHETCGDFSSHAQARKFTAKVETGAEAGAAGAAEPAIPPAGSTGQGQTAQSGPLAGSKSASPKPSSAWLKPLLAVAAVLALLLVAYFLR
jgi:hypothetical protein